MPPLRQFGREPPLVARSTDHRFAWNPDGGRWPRPRWNCDFALLCAIFLLALPSCQTTSSRPRVDPPPPRVSLEAPVVRVRIMPDARQVALSSQRDLIVTPTGRDLPRRILQPPVFLRPMGKGILVTAAHGNGQRWTTGSLRLKALSNAPIQCHGLSYSGAIVAHHRGHMPHARLDVVNHLSMERYLPGVLDRELYQHWHPNAFHAQAIAARSYTMDAMKRHRKRHFDVEATTADQAYGGMTSNAKATAAAKATHGQALTYRGRILPGYYSSCCGGLGQDAAAAFPTGLDIPPLHGRRHGQWCRKSPYFQWGPITRDKAMFAQRLRAWGRARQHDIQRLGHIIAIRVVKRNRVGRAATVAIGDALGRTFSLGAESLRLAANHGTKELPAPDRKKRLPSAQVSVTVTGKTILFHDGRGFGHGVGMCQFGSQAQALAGLTPAAILRFYYPGAVIDQVY